MIRNSRPILALDLASSLKDGIDRPIVGRSITDSPNPAASADTILREIR
jgi:orotidine-5'-phosphate decarboxylase